nr:DUF366 family protein [Methanocella sp. CWC-04]
MLIADETIDYDGSQIGSLWAYTRFRLQDDSIVCFRGKCNVTPDHMIDLEDRVMDEKIESPDMIHFIVEHFDMTSLKLAYARQRLLAAIAAEVFKDRGIIVKRSGDDLFYDGGKLSISIASASPVSHKIHFGINVRCDEYMSLEKMGITDPEAIMAVIGERYSAEYDDIEMSLRKSRPLGVYL